MRRIWLQIARTSVARIYWLATSLVTMFITARVLAPEGRGIAAAANGWVALFAMVAGLSISSAIVYVASGREERSWLPRTFGSIVAILTASSLAAWIAAAVIGVTRGETVFRHLEPALLVLAFAMLPLMMWNDSAGALLVAIDALDRLNLAQVVGATASLAAAWLFVARLGWGVYGAVLATALYQIIVAVWTLAYIVRRAGRAGADRAVVRTLLQSGLRLHASTIASFTIVQTNVLMMNAFRDTAETGHYQFAVQLLSAIHMMPVAAGLSATTMVTQEGADGAWPRQKRLLLQAVALMTAVTVIGYFLAPLVVRLIGGAEFAPSATILRVLLAGLVATTVTMMMSSQWFARGLFFHLTLLSVSFGVLSIAASYYVVPRYGAIGSAWVTNAIYTIALAANVVLGFRIERASRGVVGSPASPEQLPP